MKEEIFYRVWDKEEEEFIQNSTTKATMWKTERGAVGQRGDFFYRFETCVREATVLGMLGVVSLGYFVKEARTRHFYDEMLLLVAFGGGIVLLADLLSYLVRGWVLKAR